jgi:hypothetical protein
VTITLDNTHPTPSRPKPGPPPPDPPRRPVDPPSRGEYVLHAGQLWRVDVVHCRYSTCTSCGGVHDDFTLGRPGEWLTRVPGCEVAS